MGAVTLTKRELGETLHIAKECADLIIARALVLVGFTAIMDSAPMAPVDVFATTPLGHGFHVLWFDIGGVVAAAVLVPLALSAPFEVPESHCLEAAFRVSM